MTVDNPKNVSLIKDENNRYWLVLGTNQGKFVTINLQSNFYGKSRNPTIKKWADEQLEVANAASNSDD